MAFSTRPTVVGSAILLVLCCHSLATRAQTSSSESPGLSTGSTEEAEREKIWNSPEMLEARAHLELTFERSAQITKEQADQYLANLRAMSPDQMRIWLIQYQEQRAETRRQEAESASLRRAELRRNLPAQNVGRFRNPVAARGGPATGQPVTTQPRPPSPGAIAQQPRKPFSGPQYSGAAQPLVTSQEVARAEILRGLGPWSIY